MTQPYKIYAKCYKINENDHICFHYTQGLTKYDNPMITYCIHLYNDIVVYAPMNLVKQELNIEQCGNPWNLIPEGLAETIRSEKPQIEEQPFGDINKPIIQMFCKTEDEIVEFLQEMIFADCYGVYTRNSKNLETIKIYQDHNGDDIDKDFVVDRNTLLSIWNSETPTDLMIIMSGSLTNYCIQRVESGGFFGKIYKYFITAYTLNE